MSKMPDFAFCDIEAYFPAVLSRLYSRRGMYNQNFQKSAGTKI
jgi:hypothetical protein